MHRAALSAEVEATAARRLAGRLRFAHYPLDKRLTDFEIDFQPSIDRAVIAELSTLHFVEERRNALFLGPPGVGKGHLAIALGIAATEAGYRTSRPRPMVVAALHCPPRGQLERENAHLHRALGAGHR